MIWVPAKFCSVATYRSAPEYWRYIPLTNRQLEDYWHEKSFRNAQKTLCILVWIKLVFHSTIKHTHILLKKNPRIVHFRIILFLIVLTTKWFNAAYEQVWNYKEFDKKRCKNKFSPQQLVAVGETEIKLNFCRHVHCGTHLLSFVSVFMRGTLTETVHYYPLSSNLTHFTFSWL